MITVEELARQLIVLEPQKIPARLAFYHFIKNFLSLEQTFSQEMLDQFYDRALTLGHWQSNKKTLGETVRADLNAIATRRPFAFDLDQALHSCDIQIVNLESTRDFTALVTKNIKKLEAAGEKIRLFSLKNGNSHTTQEALLIRLQKTGRVVVEIYPNVALIVEGELQLVRPHSRLNYTIELDFDPDVDQCLATSLMRVARFRMQGGLGRRKTTGHFIQGTNFSRNEAFDKPLEEIAELLQAVKRVERYYINAASDPYYQDLYERLQITPPEGEVLL